jgi:hypothetical protein
MTHNYTSSDVLKIVDSCFHAFASNFRNDAENHANFLMSQLVDEQKLATKTKLRSTNQQDMNGQEMKEGDIFKYHHSRQKSADNERESIGLLSYNEGKEIWQFQAEILWYINGDFAWHECEVIGNIHLEPELKEYYNL